MKNKMNLKYNLYVIGLILYILLLTLGVPVYIMLFKMSHSNYIIMAITSLIWIIYISVYCFKKTPDGKKRAIDLDVRIMHRLLVYMVILSLMMIF